MAKKVWKDESGMIIPASRVTKSEKLREQVLERLAKKATDLNKRLEAFKDEFTTEMDKVYAEVLKENDIDPKDRKGNFSCFNFDRSIKAEIDISERIEFDEALIAVAKEHFDIFLDTASGSVDGMIREMIMDAFSTSKGKLDTKKVMNLTRYRTRVDAAKYPHFHKAIDAIEKGIRKPESKRYQRISIRNKELGYDSINLNFSSI